MSDRLIVPSGMSRRHFMGHMATTALALPAMRSVAFGATGPEGSEVLAAAVAGLALGLLPYSAFLLLARGCYALGDSRTPGVVSVASAVAGVVVMVAGSRAPGYENETASNRTPSPGLGPASSSPTAESAGVSRNS